MPAPVGGRPASAPLERTFLTALALAGLRIGARPIADNSMLTHIRTGVTMATGGGIPRQDPYSWTAYGHHWVVQSWLAEWSYGMAYQHGGGAAVVLEQGLLMAVLAVLTGLLARSGSPLRTAGAASLAVGVGAPFWSPRPLLFGLICLALTVLVVERRRPAWWLLPVMWVWVSTHGSFPLAGAWIGLSAAGSVIDRRTWPRSELRYAGAIIAGLAAAALNPLGPRLLWFPVAVQDKAAVFKRIVEWQSPNFQSTGALLALTCISVALVVLIRRRAPMQVALPAVGFLALGLVSVRNLPAAAVVLAPALGRALGHPDAGGPRQRAAPQDRLMVAVLVAAMSAIAVGAASTDAFAVSAYPVAPVQWLADHDGLGPRHRLVTQDFVGNYLIFRFGGRTPVFVDDRVDMYPVTVTEDYTELLHAGPRLGRILDCRGADLVLWRADQPLVQVLDRDPSWSVLDRDGDRWVLFGRSRSTPCEKVSAG